MCKIVRERRMECRKVINEVSLWRISLAKLVRTRCALNAEVSIDTMSVLATRTTRVSVPLTEKRY